MTSRAPAAPSTMFVALAWIERHCIVPDGPRFREPFRLYSNQGAYLASFYLVKPHASTAGKPSTAFVYRRALVVGPQGLGKNPVIAAQSALEFVGPATFAGYAGRDDGYACADFAFRAGVFCRCGWTYPYQEGEPMGRPWSTPHVQITALTDDSTLNTYGLLRPMIREGPLADLLPYAGEEFIRHPSGHEYALIDTVTSSNRARLGGRPTFVPQDEVGLWTPNYGMDKLADTQYRNLAKQGGRAALTTNAWDPTQNSVAQREYTSGAEDVWRYFVQAPPAEALSFTNKADRRKIYRLIYPADTLIQNGGHVDLDAIDAEMADLAKRDPAQAERFFGNRLVRGAGKAFDLERWIAAAATRRRDVPEGAAIALGFDGSRNRDSTALVATDIAGGFQWPLGIWYPPAGGDIDGNIVDAAVTMAFEHWNVVRMYVDPFFWESWASTWAGRYGRDVVIEWPTNRRRSMAYALRAWSDAFVSGELSHCPTTSPLCSIFSQHVGNAVRRDTGFRDDEGPLWTIEKPQLTDKIDAAMAAPLSWEARNDAIAAGALNIEPDEPSVYEADDDDPKKHRLLI